MKIRFSFKYTLHTIFWPMAAHPGITCKLLFTSTTLEVSAYLKSDEAPTDIGNVSTKGL